MASYAYALPIKDKARGLKLIDELTKEQEKAHHGRSKEHGFSRFKVFLQSTPHEMVIIYAESNDVAGAVRSTTQKDNQFDQWLHGAIEQITGHHVADLHKQGPMSELLLDWHETKGHSKTGHS